MRIVSWNCNGNFREKHSVLFAEPAEIYVVQECEQPDKYPDIFERMNKNFLWKGVNENKGICIFSDKQFTISDNHWNSYALRNFLCARIGNMFDLLCVWTASPYIEEYYVYQSIHKDKYHSDLIIIGDFNSNSRWDKEHKDRNHSNTVRELDQMGFVSAYHYLSGESQGEETRATFYQYRDKSRPYHIDYCFSAKQHIERFQIFDDQKWLNYSDHVPIQIDLDL